MMILMKETYKCTPGVTWRDWAGTFTKIALQRKTRNDQQIFAVALD